MIKSLGAKTAAAAIVMALAVSGCGQKADTGSKKTEPAAAETTATETTVEETPEETISPEQMKLIKYNYYVKLNNDIVTILDNIDYYYMAVEDADEFALIKENSKPYGYRIYGLNTDILDDCMDLSQMEPAFETLDPMIGQMEGSLRTLMETFSQLGRSNDYADNQYQKAKEYHALIRPAAQEFEELGYAYLDAVEEMTTQQVAEDEAAMKEEGRLIAYNASRGITICRQIIDTCHNQGVTDENLTDLDLTEIKPLYEELLAVVADLDAATADSDQMIMESLSNSRPFDGLYGKLTQSVEWMIRQVESGRPLEDVSLEPLGSIAHISNTLGECIDRYNSVIAK